jgi:hypothetical protein
MPTYLYFILGGILAFALITWGVRVSRARKQAEDAELQRLGFTPCPERKGWLEETVTAMERNEGYRYEVRHPRRLAGAREVYFFQNRRHGDDSDDAAYDEVAILFPLERPSTQGLLLVVKPSSIGPGFASRLLKSAVTADWDSQPDDLERIEIPPDLENTNLLGVLGPSGARLYDLVDPGTLGVVQRLGDLGAMFILFRDGWCVIGGGGGVSGQHPFRVGELISHIRPLFPR